MKKTQIITHGIFHAFGVLLYTILVGWVLFNAASLFGTSNTMLNVVMLLMLLVVSVAIVGVIVFLRPVMMYLDGFRRNAVYLLFATLAWLIVFVILIGTVLVSGAS